MKKILFFILTLFFVFFLLSGCDSQNADSSTPSDFEQAENPLWITPEFSNDSQASGGGKEQPLPDSNVPPGEVAIATPNIPNFEIITAKIHKCFGEYFVVTVVKNTGPYYFQYITLAVTHGDPFTYTRGWEDPWYFNGDSVCPVPVSAGESLAPGATAHIYKQVNSIPVEKYEISLEMCTYNPFPDNCPIRYYTLEESIGVLRIDIELKELVFCWVGPGPNFEVVNSIPEGSTVELLGIGDVDGYLVVQEPKYQRPCWMRVEGAEEIPDEVSSGLMSFDTPILSAGVVTGKVYKDRNANGAFGGKDEVFSGAQMSLALGSCSNPGQAITTTTNSEGWYAFYDVEPGNYCVYAAKPTTCQSFTTADSFDISVKWEAVVEKNFGLGNCR